MKKNFPFSSIGRANVIALLLIAVGCHWTLAETTSGGSSTLRIHPRVFSLIDGWISDPESPVVTEINLDAVEKNRNQFDPDEIKQEEGWTVCRDVRANGFQRYRVTKEDKNRYQVEYQENGGGTLTTSSIIDFSVMVREIRKSDVSTPVRVLRVESYRPK